MKNKNYLIYLIITVAVLCGILLSVSSCSYTVTGDDTNNDSENNNNNNNSGDDIDSSASKIILNGNSAKADASRVIVTGSTIDIVRGGTYTISGTLDDGKILITADKNEDVNLILNGANITNNSGAAIYSSGSNLIITLAAGSDNLIVDGGSNFIYDDMVNQEPNAAIFAKNDITIKGTGFLTVIAGYNNGIGCKDNLVIENGNLIVTAKDSALRGSDSVVIIKGTFNLTAESDGIQTGNNTDGKGNIYLYGGNFLINSGNDGIQAETALTITGGTYDIISGGGANSSSYNSSESYKGLKAATDISIDGGKFNISSMDDSIHANGNVTISNGEFIIESGDDGIHADTDLTITDGTITIKQSYEALEANNIYISGGNIDLTASDDGINAAGGSSNGGQEAPGRFGGDRFAGGGGDYTIDISGGNIKLSAGGDGLDSNGTINISGGTLISLISSGEPDSALDSDGYLTVSGGTVIAGGTGTYENLSETSPQSYVYLENLVSGDEIIVKSSDDILAAYIPDRNLNSLVIFASGIISGQDYTVSINGVDSTVTAGTGGGHGGFGGGFGGGRPRGDWGNFENMPMPDGDRGNFENMPTGDFENFERPTRGDFDRPQRNDFPENATDTTEPVI